MRCLMVELLEMLDLKRRKVQQLDASKATGNDEECRWHCLP